MMNRGVRTIGPPRVQRQRGRLPFDGALEARLPYVENFALTASGATALTTTTYTFYANNMYDPRIEVGGHQPMQYDLLALAFSRYFVHDVDVSIQFSNPTIDGMYVGYRVRQYENPVATSGQTLDYIQEMSNVAINGINDTGSQTVTYRFRINIADFMGIPRIGTRVDPTYSGEFDGGFVPTRPIYIEPFALSTSGNDGSIRCNVTLNYHALCSGLRTVTQS